MTNGTDRRGSLRSSAPGSNPDLESVKVGTAERASRASDDSRGKKAQARAPGGRVDDDDQGSSFDCSDPEAFRSGQVEVAFE